MPIADIVILLALLFLIVFVIACFEAKREKDADNAVHHSHSYSISTNTYTISHHTSLDRTTSLSFDFEDQYGSKLEKMEEKIERFIDEFRLNSEKAETQFRNALDLCRQYKDWCFSQGAAGKAYYECQVNEIEQRLLQLHKGYELYGFPVSCSAAQSYSDDIISSNFYDYRNKDIEKYISRINSLINNLAENPKSNLSRFEKALSMCDDFENWCNNWVGGQKYYLIEGHSIRDAANSAYEEYQRNYDQHVVAYKVIQAQKRLVKKIKKEVVDFLASNNGSYKQADIPKVLDYYDKENVIKAIDLGISDGTFCKQKINGRIYIVLSDKEHPSQ